MLQESRGQVLFPLLSIMSPCSISNDNDSTTNLTEHLLIEDLLCVRFYSKNFTYVANSHSHTMEYKKLGHKDIK